MDRECIKMPRRAMEFSLSQPSNCGRSTCDRSRGASMDLETSNLGSKLSEDSRFRFLAAPRLVIAAGQHFKRYSVP